MYNIYFEFVCSYFFLVLYVKTMQNNQSSFLSGPGDPLRSNARELPKKLKNMDCFSTCNFNAFVFETEGSVTETHPFVPSSCKL